MKRLVLVLLAVLLTSSGCSAYSATFSASMTITAHFRDSVGLYVGNAVSVLGIDVGRVTRIQPHGLYTKVSMSVDREVRIPADAGAVTVSPSVVTDRHVELTPAYQGGPTMKPGDLIPLERTRTPVELDEIVDSVDDLADQLSKKDGGPGVVQDATDVAAENLKGNGERINSTISSLAEAVNSASGQRDALTSLIKNVDKLSSASAKNDALIRRFSTTLTRVTKLFADESPRIGNSIERMNDLLDETVGLVREFRGPGKESLRKAGRTLNTIVRNSNSLAETIDVLPLLFENVSRAVDHDHNKLRVHSDVLQLVMDTDAINILCNKLEIGLPGCRSGKPNEFGPDLGVTELLLGAVK